jgi:hypothetical protein
MSCDGSSPSPYTTSSRRPAVSGMAIVNSRRRPHPTHSPLKYRSGGPVTGTGTSSQWASISPHPHGRSRMNRIASLYVRA